MPFKAIVAYAKKNRVIGNQGKIPWHLKEDFRHFQATTMGGMVVMGRKTYDSLGCAFLRGRMLVVLTKKNTYGWDNLERISPTPPRRKEYSVFIMEPDAIHELDKAAENADVWIAGGADIYTMFLPKCTEVIATEVEGDFEGDVFMPEFKFKSESVVSEHAGFAIKKYIL